MGELPVSTGTDGTRETPRIGDAVAVVDDVLRRGIEHGASDIHFEPTPGGLVVKFRLDGVLSVVDQFPGELAARIVARLKVLSGLLTYRTDIPQEGRIDPHPDAGRGVTEQRVSIFPTIHGQRAVVRLFYDQAELADLTQLGLPDHILEALRRIAASNQGVLLMTGPAGSGKSTTLAAVLKHVVDHCPGKSIVALEDPVERHMAGVTQVQITPHGEMTFPTALRSLLRQDPQVLMIGEIRDAETARIAIQAGLTGHLLMSTLHSATPAAALLRLLDMGIEPYQVTSSVVAVANQRLVRRLCVRCRRRGEGPAGPFQPAGCPACLGTGFLGRALIAEMVQLDGELRRAVLAKADLEELERILAARGHMGLRHAGMQLVAAGTTTEQELDSVCPDRRE